MEDPSTSLFRKFEPLLCSGVKAFLPSSACNLSINHVQCLG